MLYWNLWVRMKKCKGAFVYTFLFLESEKRCMRMWLRCLSVYLQLLTVPTFHRVKRELQEMYTIYQYARGQAARRCASEEGC